jgi:transposase-like protein
MSSSLVDFPVELSEPDAEKWLPLLLALKVPESASAVNTTRTLAPGFQEARTIRQVQKRLTPEERRLIARKYEAGATAVDLAVEFGCHPMTATKAVKENGVAMRFAKKTTADQADEAVRLYRSGLSMEKAGERLGLSGRTIFGILRERGVTSRDTHGRDR